MFKKKRNALLEEMREIAENETFRVLESMGLVEMRLLVSGPHGSSTQYSATPTKDRAARALAEEAKAAAEEALEAAGVAGVASVEAARSINLAGDLRGDLEAELSANIGDRPVCVLLKILGEGCPCLRGEPVGRNSCEPADGLCEERVLLRKGSYGSLEFGDVRVLARSGKLLPRVIDLACDAGADSSERGDVFGHHVCAHVSSPVVAESEADTSDAPAMTVQEGGSSDAAPGVGWATVARSTPRFVVLGALVYDRDANKAVSCISSSAAQSVAAELNANHGNHNRFYWEDAK